MAKTAYGHFIRSFSFQDFGPGLYRQGTRMNGEFLGFDVCIEYGTFYAAGKVGRAPFDAETHDYDQVSIWMGTDTYDMGYLGAEVEVMVGEEMEKHVLTTSTAIAIPKGFQHGPASIVRMDRRFIQMSVSMTRETKSTPVHSDITPKWPGGFQAKYRENVQHLAFTRNGPWHYGPNNADTHGGAITEIKGKDFDFHMSYESMNKAPYRFGPVPDKPHVHPYTEFLLFIGADGNNLSELGAECEMYMGKEMEKHVITTPSVAIQPKGHPHCPLIVNKQDRPWIFAVVRPFGHTGTGQSGYIT
ncbi:MAG: hypothetical protein A2Z29_03845 [Chloroflexi bacterium RBG_16_56_11]|nr:MAG: hypothetical protein A2Z29_03845 [Chloroflexi bacterium RBG_16_56_11]